MTITASKARRGHPPARRSEPPPLTLAAAAPGQHLTDPKGVAFFDLTANLWAGMPVRIELQAKDALGQVGTSETMETVLPERNSAIRSPRP